MEILRVPKLNENMDAATVGAWAKAVGESVSAGEVVVELITDKANLELEAGEEGVLRVVAATEKSTVPVGFALAVIAAADEDIPDVESENASLMESYAAGVSAEVVVAPRSSGKATPAARRLARQKGLTVSEVAEALGITGVVEKADVLKYIRERS